LDLAAQFDTLTIANKGTKSHGGLLQKVGKAFDEKGCDVGD